MTGPQPTAPQRLRRRADFVAANKGARVNAKAFSLQDRVRGDDAPPRVGFTVTKKIGRATKRNRIRRRLKEALRLLAGTPLKAGHDYVMVARQEALTLGFTLLQQDIAKALGRIEQGGKGRSRRPGTQDRTERT